MVCSGSTVHKPRALTQTADGFLTLLDLFSHHPADAHQTLSNVTGCLYQVLLGGFPTYQAHQTKQKKKCLSVTPELLRSATMSEFLEQYWRNKTLFPNIFLHSVIWWWWLLTVMSNKTIQKISHRADELLTTDHLSVTLNTRTHPGLCSESSAVQMKATVTYIMYKV